MTTTGGWDVVVVGAGPAGSITALAALHERPGARVLLLDRADFPRDKSCGDGIAPHVLDVLEAVGASGVADDLRREHRGVGTLELALGDLSSTREMRRPALVIPREQLDARLVEAAVAAGAVLRRHRVRDVRVEEDGVVVDDEIRARVLVGADGAQSQVRRSLGLALPGRLALGLRGYAPTPPARAGRQVIRFAQDRQPSYAWAFDRGDGWSNVGYGEILRDRRDRPTQALMRQRLEELLPGSTEGARTWRGHHLPLSTARWGSVQPDGRVLLVGDAAGLINPMTGEGIYYAAVTGQVAGRAAARADEGGDPGAAYRCEVRRLLRANLVSTAIGGRVASHPFLLAAGLRAAAADQRVFDDLVELGLGPGRLTPRVVAGLVRHAR